MSVYKDIYLPIHCYASKKQFYSLVGECACMTKCKFMSESQSPKTEKNLKEYPAPLDNGR
jgi:hypothetical protein